MTVWRCGKRITISGIEDQVVCCSLSQPPSTVANIHCLVSLRSVKVGSFYLNYPLHMNSMLCELCVDTYHFLYQFVFFWIELKLYWQNLFIWHSLSRFKFTSLMTQCQSFFRWYKQGLYLSGYNPSALLYRLHGALKETCFCVRTISTPQKGLSLKNDVQILDELFSWSQNSLAVAESYWCVPKFSSAYAFRLLEASQQW